MKKLSFGAKIFIAVIVSAVIFLAVMPFVFYLKILPDAVSNPKVINYVQKVLKDSAKLDFVIENPVLKTELSPVIRFKTQKILLKNNDEILLNVKNLDIVFSFEKIFKHRIDLQKAGVDYLFADVNKLMELGTGEEQKAEPSDWTLGWFDSLLYVKNCVILYQITPDTLAEIEGKNIEITSQREPKYVHFDIQTDVKKGKEKIHISLKDNNKVFIKDRKLFIDDTDIAVNNSKIFIKSVSDDNNNFALNVHSKKFDIKNVVELLETNLVVPNGGEMLAFFKNIKGNFDFKIRLTNKDIKGEIILNNASLNVIPLNNLPLALNHGIVDITAKDITLRDFKGWYGTKSKNKIEFHGKINDYTKSVDTVIEATGIATNELTKNYLSKLVGCPLELTGDCGTKMIIKSVYNKIDLTWMFKVAKGKDILVDGASLSPVNYDRALKADFHFENNLLNIESINYYIASVIDKNSKGKIKPILTIKGNVDFSKDVFVKNLGFDIPKPLPSEFLNVLIGQKIFKKGTIAGHLQYINDGKTPKLDGEVTIEKVRIPSQRLSVKYGKLTTDNGSIHLNAFGRFKRSDYKLTGNIKNSLLLPIIVKNINLTVEDVNIEKLIASFNNQNTEKTSGIDENAAIAGAQSEEASDDSYTFDTGLLIVEDCVLNVVKGVYKEINFSNLKATLTLDKNGILQIKSNRFDFAEGISSCKVYCDLKKHLYSVKLGVKNINSDVISTALLALPKEISGKASGIIHINTDDSLKLNGKIKFVIKNGTIGKVGLVEYALKFASLFRNPMAMVSPSTIFDLVNIPDGSFDKIIGDLAIKDNVVEKIMIKSTAPELSSFIIGRFDLETRDATLRIYTKFSNKNKGLAGVLRNISLSSIANRVPLSSNNDSNYYAAELEQLPPIEAEEKDCQVFLTKVDGDVEHFNFISSLKKIK